MEKYEHNLEIIKLTKENDKLTLKLEGWIICDSNNILLKIDENKNYLKFNELRIDVKKHYGISDNNNHGFNYEVEVEQFECIEISLENNNKELILCKFNFEDIPKINKDIEYNLETIEFKNSNNKIDLFIEGWAINKEKKSDLEIEIRDNKNKFINNKTEIIKRNDVVKKYEQSKLNSGFKITFNINKKIEYIEVFIKEENALYLINRVEIPSNLRITNLDKLRSIIKINSKMIKKAINIIFKSKSFKMSDFKMYMYKYKNNLSKEISNFSNMINFSKDVDPYQEWVKNNQISNRVYINMKKEIEKLHYKPKISILMPVYNVEKKWLDKAIKSIKDQAYENWELCIADDCSTKDYIKPYLKELERQDYRIKFIIREKNGNISAATNDAFSISTGKYIVLMDNDDELTKNALFEIVKSLQNADKPEIIYSDDDKIDELGKRYSPQFKPDWSPELLLSFMYFSHIFCFKRELYEQVGGCRIGFEGCQDYDLALRMTEVTDKIKHIDTILYHWRSIEGSTAQDANAKPEAFERGVRAVQEALIRRNIDGKVKRPDFAQKLGLGIFSIDFPNDGPLVSIIIPTKNQKKLLKRCIDSIINKTKYKNYQIVIINNDTDEKDSMEYIDELRKKHIVLDISNQDGKFSYAYINNEAVKRIDSEYILFLNNDTEVISENWLSSMVGYVQIKDVGIVGARLLFPDNRVQHAGVVLGLYNGMVAPAFKLLPEYSLGYFNFAKVARNYSCVTAACMIMKKTLFEELNGFDEKKFAVAYNDVDLCIRCLEKGKRIVYSPDAELYHYEGASRGYVDNIDEILNYKELYGHFEDRYYNKNLSLYDEQFNINPENSLGYSEGLNFKNIILSTHNLNYEGAPLHLYEIAKGIKSKYNDCKIHVISPQDGPLSQMYTNIGISVEIYPFNIFMNLNESDYKHNISKLIEFIKYKNPDFIYANTLETFHFIDIANELGIPSLWNIHESTDYKSYYSNAHNYVQKKYIQSFINARKVVFVCDETLKMYSNINLANNFDYIYNGIDNKYINKYKSKMSKDDAKSILNIRKENKVVSIIGTVCERKGQLDFVKAAIDIIKDNESIIFYVVGCRCSDYLDKIKHLIKSNKVQNRIILIDETKDVNLYYRASDIFVCASYNESFPRVTLEAMAFGLPIITTPVFGLKEQIRENVNGLYFNPGDIDKLEENIKSILNDKGLYYKLSKNAIKVQLSLNSHDEMINKYIDIIMRNI